MTKQSATREGVLERGKTDWTAVEKQYRAGVLSIREIAKLNDVTEGGIRYRAKAEGWQRDLKADVAAAADQALRTDYAAPTRAREDNEQARRDAIAEGAATVVEVVRSHRQGIRNGRELVETLLYQLGGVARERDYFEQVAIEETAGDKGTKRRNFLLDAVGLPRHAATVRDLSVALKNVVALERQAFGLGDAAEETPPAGEAEAANAPTPGLSELESKWERVLGRAPTTH